LDTPYNAENAAGLSFLAKGSGTFDVNIADDNSTYGTGHCNTCVPFTAPIQLSDTWTRYTILFDGVQQSPYWGDQFVQLDRSAIHQISWINITPAKQFDIWIDNVEWVGCEGALGAGL
jgi:hypothetical protein